MRKQITLLFEDGNTISTEINGTEEQIRLYYKGFVLVTENFETGEETKTKLKSITFHN